MLPEVLPPKGVATAIDAAHPVLLRYEEFDGANADDAAVKVKPGQSGGTELDAISTRAPDGEPFPLAQGGKKLEIYVPAARHAPHERRGHAQRRQPHRQRQHAEPAGDRHRPAVERARPSRR